MKNNTLVSVYTATYNREYSLHLPYNSLCKQTYTHFEWLIVDGGSDDNTKNLVEQWKKEAPFPIYYLQLSRSGKHIAMNRLFQMASGKYAIGLDSDDELLPDAIEKGVKIWESIPNPEEYWIVSGRCIGGESSKIVGPLFPDGINDLPLKKQQKIYQKIPGEKSDMRRVDILKEYAFPEIEGIRYIGESYLWDQIHPRYKKYCTNEIFRVYYNSQDALSRLKDETKHKDINTPEYTPEYTYYWNSIIFINDIYGKYAHILSKSFISCVCALWKYAFYLNYSLNSVSKEIHSPFKRIIVICIQPFSNIIPKLWEFLKKHMSFAC